VGGFLADDGLAIFLFHGVIAEQRHQVRNYTRKHILASRFEAVLRELLSNGGRPVSMDRVVESTERAEPLPPRAFAVTFDDGVENNASVATPILRAHRVPGTFYVTTGFVVENTASWIDMIEYAFEREPSLGLDVPGLGRRRCTTAGEKIAVVEDIRRHVKSDPAIDPYAHARAIWRALGVTTMEPDPDLDRKRGWGQVRMLARDPLFTVGGHGHTHRILSFLKPDDLERELDLSLSLLRECVGREIAHYSYPEGLARHYSPRVIDALRARGIRCSPTAIHGTNRAGDSLFHLRRIMVS
jgi:peptidoglycan/xylan/chitin deacetylase (PgdA/CDA1 family)